MLLAWGGNGNIFCPNKKKKIMEHLHPAAQVAAIVMIGLAVICFFLGFTGFFDNISQRKK